MVPPFRGWSTWCCRRRRQDAAGVKPDQDIEAQRLGVTVVAVDRYPNAPAMQVAHRSHVVPMTDPVALRRVLLEEKPDWLVAERESYQSVLREERRLKARDD